jgi:hypothetical protein
MAGVVSVQHELRDRVRATVEQNVLKCAVNIVNRRTTYQADGQIVVKIVVGRVRR